MRAPGALRRVRTPSAPAMSFLETLVILLVAVVVLGPKRLPEAARKVGHWMGVLRRASDEFKQQLMTMDQALEKQVNTAVNASTGERLGYVSDVMINGDDGRISALVVPGPAKFFGLLGREADYVLPWENISRLGEDIILINSTAAVRRKKRP